MTKTEYTRKWREEHPERYAQLSKKFNNSVSARRLRNKMANSRTSIGKKSYVNEILRCHAKGRSVVDIAIWVNQPVSVVEYVLKNHQIPKADPLQKGSRLGLTRKTPRSSPRLFQ